MCVYSYIYIYTIHEYKSFRTILEHFPETSFRHMLRSILPARHSNFCSRRQSPRVSDDIYVPKHPSEIMTPLWHHGTIAPRAPPKIRVCPKTNLSSEGVLRAWRAGAHAETLGNVYSFAHAKYIRKKVHISWPSHFYLFEKVLFGLAALRAPTVRP